MINFEEELKKFQPSMEIEQVENAVYDHDLTDMTDILLEMMKNEKETQEAAALIKAAIDDTQPLQ
ncbi:MAG: hypothetical protein K5886_12550 [Lachnospiraceae bacterium]|nr:hypothetical protein [Lachnospiraceae bacterium]